MFVWPRWLRPRGRHVGVDELPHPPHQQSRIRRHRAPLGGGKLSYGCHGNDSFPTVT